MMTKEYPFVPRVAFLGQHQRQSGTHIMCGNGAHYFWSTEAEQWVELEPLPGSARAAHFKEEAAREANQIVAEERQAKARIAAEAAKADYEQRRQAALQKQAKLREMMTLEAFVVGVLRETNFFMAGEGFYRSKVRNQGVTRNTVVRDVLQSSRNKWDAEQITQCLMDLVHTGTVRQIEKPGASMTKPHVLYRLADNATGPDVESLEQVSPAARISV